MNRQLRNALKGLASSDMESRRRAMEPFVWATFTMIEPWMKGVSNRAIAVQLKTIVGAVKMPEYRTILKLKKMLREYCGEV